MKRYSQSSNNILITHLIRTVAVETYFQSLTLCDDSKRSDRTISTEISTLDNYLNESPPKSARKC